MSLIFSTFILFTAEACFAWLFVLGLAWALRAIAERRHGVFFPKVRHVDLVRFMWFQVWLLVVWSVCFKAALYTSLLPWYSHDLMAKGQSLGIAIPSEVLALLLALVGVVSWMRSRSSAGNLAKRGAREEIQSGQRIDDLVEWYRTFGPIAFDEFDRRRGVE